MNSVDKIQRTFNFTDSDIYSFQLCFKEISNICYYGVKYVKLETINKISVT